MSEDLVISDAVMAELRADAEARRAYWKNKYERLSSSKTPRPFLNLGFADLDAEPEALAGRGLEGFGEDLYRHIVSDVDLHGKQVLEIGCGGGGGSRFLMETYGPMHLTAVDIAEKAIERCRQLHPIPELIFQVGDAENLPFERDSFDRVINVESSHCYGSREQSLREVHRVLVSGGVLMFADIFIHAMDPIDMKGMDELLQQTGFEVLRAQDITPHVLKARALTAVDPSVCELLGEQVPEAIRQAIREAFFLPGAKSHLGLQTGTDQYGSWILQKR